MLITLANTYKHFKCLLIPIYLNKAKKIQDINPTKESIPKDSKHPINQYFCEYLNTAQNATT